MRRVVDLRCLCGFEEINAYLEENDLVPCKQCGRIMEQIWWARPPKMAQWSDNEAVVVFLDQKTGKPRYPGRNTAPTPAGYDRHVMRSLRDVERFERNHGVVNEAMHFDRGSGRGMDDYVNNSKLTH